MVDETPRSGDAPSPEMPMASPPRDKAWTTLRSFTDARIGLGRSGAAIPTGETLRFKLAHAQARDAVHTRLENDTIVPQLEIYGLSVLACQSEASDRSEYLKRPDKGRRLSADSRALLTSIPTSPYDIAIVIADGLSALAIELNASPFLTHFLTLIADFQLAPLVVVQQGRVAIGDEIGQLFGAKAVIVLIGERPGLSSPDSMGLYLTFAPRPGLTDERRNCISNVREAGLSHAAAAEKLTWLLRESLRRGLSGVELKDETTSEKLIG